MKPYAPSTALIVVDVQNDFIAGGALAVPGGKEVAQQVAMGLIPAAKEGSYDYVVGTQDWHISPGEHFETWPVHAKAASTGAEFAPVLDPWMFDAVFRKGQHSDGYSGFEGRTSEGRYLSDWLLGHHIDRVDIVGIALDHCVKATALDARRYGLKVRVLINQTVAVDPTKTDEVIAELKAAGVEIGY